MKFITASCQSKWQNKCCERACMLVFADVPEIKDKMREVLKLMMEQCPMKEKLSDKKPIFK